jgi:uncharacterized Rossmann fold enzyme
MSNGKNKKGKKVYKRMMKTYGVTRTPDGEETRTLLNPIKEESAYTKLNSLSKKKPVKKKTYSKGPNLSKRYNKPK